jgi:hypothetical protein
MGKQLKLIMVMSEERINFPPIIYIAKIFSKSRLNFSVENADV